MNLNTIAARANDSVFWRYILNYGLWKKVPFNRPHGLWVSDLTDARAVVEIPWKPVNKNHINTLHACAMATASEYASGLFLLHRLGNKYRLIMESFDIQFHYRGEGRAVVEFQMTEDEFLTQVQEPLEREGLVFVKLKVLTHDPQQNLLSTCFVNWQLKAWRNS